MPIAIAGSSTLTNTNALTNAIGCGTRTVAAGSLLVAVASIDRAAAFTASSCSDATGNTWNIVVATADNTGLVGRLAIAYAMNAVGGSTTPQFNLDSSASSFANAGFSEFTGVKTASALDTSNSNSNIDTSGATKVTPGSINTGDAGDLILGAATIRSTTDTNVNFASPTNWSTIFRQNNNPTPGTGPSLDFGYWLPGAVQSSYNPAWGHDNNVNDRGAGMIFAFKPTLGLVGAFVGNTALTFTQIVSGGRR